MRKYIAVFLFFLSSLAAAEPEIGSQFKITAKNSKQEKSDKIEVVMLFSYTCKHCYDLDKILTLWVKKLPKDVVFRRVPVVFRMSMEPTAKAYYVIEKAVDHEKLNFETLRRPEDLIDYDAAVMLNSRLFNEIHNNKLNPVSESNLIKFIANSFSSSSLFEDETFVRSEFKSLETAGRLKGYSKVLELSGAEEIPSLVIDGRFITSSAMAKGHAQALQVADFLIGKVRAEKRSGK